MKKIVTLVAVLALTAPVFAQDVNIELKTVMEDKDGSGVGPWVEVSYDASGVAELPRGFSFDMELDNGGEFLAIDEYKEDVYSTAASKGFGVYLGTIQFGGDPLDITGIGSPVATFPGSLTNGTLNAPGITVELGSLYEPTVPTDAPNDTGKLFSVKVNKLNTALTITAEEDHRGGIILEDGVQANLVCPVFMVAWGLASQCHGDSNGTLLVDTDDFGDLRDSWFKTYPDPAYNPAADFTQDGVVDTDDFGKLRDNWFKPVIADCPPASVWPPVI